MSPELSHLHSNLRHLIGEGFFPVLVAVPRNGLLMFLAASREERAKFLQYIDSQGERTQVLIWQRAWHQFTIEKTAYVLPSFELAERFVEESRPYMEAQ